MSVRNNLPLNYIPNKVDALARIIHELREIVRQLKSSSGGGSSPAYETGAGAVTPDTLRVTMESGQFSALNDIETILTNTKTVIDSIDVLLTDIEANTDVLNTLDKDSGVVSPTTLRVVPDSDTFDEIRATRQRLENYDRNIGLSTSETLRVVLEDGSRNNIGDINSKLTTINTNISYENWDKIAGNSKEFVWINGSLPGNRVVQTITYKTGASTVITQTFTYNGNDEVVTIAAS